MLQAVIRKHGEVLSKGGVGGNITKEGVGVPTGGVTGGGGGVKRVSSVMEGGGKRSLTALGRVDAMYQNVVKYGPLDERQVTFETDLAVLVSKETSLPLSIVTSPWLRTLVLRRDPRIVFPDRRFFTETIIPRVRKICEDVHTTPYLTNCHGVWLTFDLWMKGGIKVDVFGINAHVIVDPCDFGAPPNTPWIKKVYLYIFKQTCIHESTYMRVFQE